MKAVVNKSSVNNCAEITHFQNSKKYCWRDFQTVTLLAYDEFLCDYRRLEYLDSQVGSSASSYSERLEYN